jgi:hypothetical protein
MQIKHITIAASPSVKEKYISNIFQNIRSSISGFINKITLFLLKPFRKLNGSMKKRNMSDGVIARSGVGKRSRFNFNYKRYGKVLLLIIIVAAVVIGGRELIGSSSNDNSGSEVVEVKGATATEDLNREFSFPLRDADGEEVSRVKYTIEKAELRNEIIVKGQKATAVKGRTFLIVTLKIQNEYKSPIEIDTRDYVRLSVNGNRDEWLAPDIHNDPVEVQAISTKYTRLGFPINDTDNQLVLRVGEIDNEKEEISLNLR